MMKKALKRRESTTAFWLNGWMAMALLVGALGWTLTFACEGNYCRELERKVGEAADLRAAGKLKSQASSIMRSDRSSFDALSSTYAVDKAYATPRKLKETLEYETRRECAGVKSRNIWRLDR